MTDNEITYQIRGAVFDVYNTLGPGLLESVYEEALVFELEQRGLKVERQKLVPINYKGNVLKTELRLDLFYHRTKVCRGDETRVLQADQDLSQTDEQASGLTC